MTPFRRPPRRRSFSVPSSNKWRARPVVEVLEDRLAPAIFTVNDLGDGGTFSGNSGDLRYCIEQANADPDLDTIVFDLPGVGIQTIQPLSALPTIVHPVNIDGYTQTGASPNTLIVGSDAVLLIELNGSQAGAGVSGLTLTGSGSKISGLIINAFDGYGVAVVGPATFNTIAGNFIGTDHSGTSAVPNAIGGVGVLDNTASFTFIGGEPAPARNLISGNTGPGIFIAGPDTFVQNNYIGTDASGTTALGNEAQGVVVSATTGVTIGGLAARAGNVIAGNAGAGIRLFDAVGNLIQGNLIGLDAVGTNELPNLDGVRVEGDSSNNVIGFNSYAETVLNDEPLVYYRLGEAAGATTAVNLGSLGSAANGTYQGSVGLGTQGALVGDADTAATFDATDTDRVSTNPIAFPTAAFTAEVWMQSTTPGTESALISYAVSAGGRDNEFLLLYTGGEFVIYIRSANDNADSVATGVGGTFDGDWHHLAVTWFGATGDLKLYVDGVERFSGVLQAGTTLTTGGSLVLGQDQDSVGGNFDAAQAYLGNLDEFALYDKPLVASEIQTHFLAGHDPEAARNVISGNTNAGVVLNGANVTANRVTTNYIGTSADGVTALPNGSDGVYLTAGANGNTIGGLTLTPGTILGNVVSGNDVHGVHLDGTAGGSNLIQGNILGLAADGLTDISSGIGVRINRGENNVVGGTDTRARNIVSGNANGIVLSASGSNLNTLIQNNFIGTDISGSQQRGNGTGINVGSAPGTLVIGNVVSGNGVGISISNISAPVIGGTFNSVVQGNLIGLKADGSAALGNNTGIVIINDDNLIGGTTAAERNIISGNALEGVRLGTNAAGNVVQGNYIGTNVAGAAALGNLRGVVIENGASNNTIDGNVISGNTANDTLGTGIHISGATTTGNVVQGNLIGLGADGTTIVGNAGPGVQIEDAPGNTIGGTATGAGNTISGNRSGVGISGGTATDNLVQGNRIGTDLAGTSDRGNLEDGVAIVGASGNTIGGAVTGAGNVISGNDDRGVVLGNGADGNTIQGNYIGTNAAGTADLGNTLDGLFVQGDNNLIGGTTALERNVISGNNRFGVQLRAGAHGNMVQGNFIGTNAAGAADLGNTSHGVQIVDATNNTVSGNVISGNDAAGVRVASAAADGNVISGNFIGTNASGTGDLGNASVGVLIEAGSANTTVGALNLISGNGDAGILIRDATTTGVLIQGNFIGTDVTGANDLGNDKEGIRVEVGADGVIIGGTVPAARNVVSGNNEGGIRIQSANNVVQGNYIGLQANGLTGRPNISSDALRGFGIEVTGADNLIGGATSAPGTEAGNVIASNGQGGVGASGVGVWVRGVAGTRIEGNLISLNQNGATPGGFQQFGVLLSEGATNTVIGGTDSGVRNVIAGSGLVNVELRDEATTNNVVQGNYIGTNPAGSAGIAGTNFGIHLNNAEGNLIGGSTAEARNLISGHNGDGIRVTNVDVAAGGTAIQGNWIGLDASGTNAIPNVQSGIVVINSRYVLIGGTEAGAGNVISGGAGSAGAGIGINLAQTSNRNTIQGNFIGTDHTGTLDLGNKIGVQVRQDIASLIGGTTTEARNIISGNDQFGILVTFVPSRVLRVQGNWIGLNANGDALPNGVGIQLEQGADQNLIGVRGYEAEIRADAPRLYWRLDEAQGATTAVNRGTLGTAADGTYLGNVLLEQQGALAGDANTAASFGAGNDDAVRDSSFAMPTVRFTFETWVLSNSSAAVQTIASYAVAGSPNEFALISTNNQLGIYLNSASDVIDGVTSVNTGVDVLDGQWHHVVVTWDSDDGSLLLYKDGLLVFSTTLQTGNTLTTNGAFVIAQDQDSVGGGFDAAQRFIGTLDEVAVYSGALPDHEVAAHYAAGVHTGGQNVISGNATHGVVITGGTFQANNNVIAGNFIGTDATGTLARPNGENGIEINGGAHDNLIGGTTPAARNLISGNVANGVQLRGDSPDNAIVGNYIGTQSDGLSALPNNTGINVDSPNTTITNNVVSGNTSNGLFLFNTGGVVQGNLIGLGCDGTTEVGNGIYGIHVASATGGVTGDLIIGGTTPAARNVISANSEGIRLGIVFGTGVIDIQGNYIGTDSTGTQDRGNTLHGIVARVADTTLTIGGLTATPGTGAGNVISGNDASGVVLQDNSDPIVVLGNLIGTDVTGTTALGNHDLGVWITGGGNTIGGTDAQARNVISGNLEAGIGINTATGVNNVAIGNYIGTDVLGTTDIPNDFGVRITLGAAGNTIGGTTAAERNVISGNSQRGVAVSQAGSDNAIVGNFIGPDATGTATLSNLIGISIFQAANTDVIGNVIAGNASVGIQISSDTGTTVQGNLIGTNPTGSAVLGGQGNGIIVESISNNLLIGGPLAPGGGAGTGNVISGHGNGIVVSNSGGAPTGLVVQGNRIGTDLAGAVALGNTTGIDVNLVAAGLGTLGLTIADNLISGNDVGVRLRGSAKTTGVVVAGNFIGTDALGTTAIPNLTGVAISEGATANTIGGTLASARNIISGNIDAGVVIVDSATMGNVVAGNFIGTDATGSTALGGQDGVILSAPGNTVSGNLVSGHTRAGILVNGANSSGNRIQGNAIGLKAAGDAALPNVMGVFVNEAGRDNLIGTDADGTNDAAERNVISGNTSAGIQISGGEGGTIVAGNYIGTDVNGTVAVGNTSASGNGGVYVQGSPDTLIGGTSSAARNIISGNLDRGVIVELAASVGTLVQGNWIGLNVNGDALGNATEGVSLQVGATGVTVAGNVVSANQTHGIAFQFGTTSGNFVQGNLIGTDPSGSAARGNLGAGVYLTDDASNNTIGGLTATAGTGAGNVISGNLGHGVLLNAAANLIQGNLVGLNAAGDTALANGSNGVGVNFNGNTIGGTDPGAGNVISGNTEAGIATGSLLTSLVIEGNFVGTNRAGTAALGNGTHGIVITNSGGVRIGGATAAARNLISGNTVDGVLLQGDLSLAGNTVQGNYIGTDVTGAAALGNGSSGVSLFNAPNNSILDNVIGANRGPTSAGVSLVSSNGSLVGASNNVVAGNRIGTNAAGSAALGNLGSGVALIAGPGGITTGNTIGGNTPQARNLISGNSFSGVFLGGASTTDNQVLGNYIGLDATGTVSLGSSDGVHIAGAANNQIGDGVGGGNVIAGNSIDISVFGDTAVGNKIQGNIISADATGGTSIPPSFAYGILLSHGASHNLIGTDADGSHDAGERNVIAVGSIAAIFIEDIAGQGTQTGNVIAGNYIGLDPTGTAYLGNSVSGRGVWIQGGVDTRIGTNSDGVNDADERNVIAAGSGSGVGILITQGTGTTIAGNYIGTDASGSVALGGGGSVGVQLIGQFGAPVIGTTIGGMSAAARNVISGHGLYGVEILYSGATSNSVQGNYIGTDASGTADLGNGQIGVYLFDAGGNTVVGNVISGNDDAGIRLEEVGTTNTQIIGNLIGTDATGQVSLGNGGAGISIVGAPNNFIGGATAGTGNVISGNGNGGVLITGATAADNRIAGNYIGLNAAGTAALGNVESGVYLASAGTGNVIGGTTADERNVISGNRSGSNTGAGVFNSDTAGTIVVGNYIGTDAAGTAAVGNEVYGVLTSLAAQIGTDGDGSHDATEGNLISGNGVAGVAIGGSASDTENVVVAGNFIGTDVTGTVPLGGQTTAGVLFTTQLPVALRFNRVGTNADGVSDDLERNVISGNGGAGVLISGFAGATVSANVVAGNFIGTDVSGLVAVGNLLAGVRLKNGATGNIVGGTGSARNVISGNLGDGILIEGAATSANAVMGNYIGTDATGNATLNNGGNGILLSGAGAHSVVVNLISGNALDGIRVDSSADSVIAGNWIGLNVDGDAALGNLGSGVRLGTGSARIRIGTDGDGVDDAGEANVISGNGTLPTGHGILATGSDHLIAGNFIGTDPTGSVALGNRGNGVLLDTGAVDVTVLGNVVSGNLLNGVRLTGSGTTGNQLVGNRIGTDVFGTQELNNAEDGVHIDGGATGNIVGGDAVEERNLISGNASDGVEISGVGTMGNVVSGNYIGIDANGAALGQQSGVLIGNGAANNVVGGLTAAPGSGAGNVIGGNVEGVSLNQSGAGNVVQGNVIGGADALANVYGVVITSAAGNLIGGGAAGAANVIDGNSAYGVFLQGAGTSGNFVQGNRIGVDAANFFGVYVLSVDGPNFIGTDSNGTTDAAEGNRIANNSGAGVVVLLSTSLTIAGNQIEANANVGVQIQDSPTTVGGLTTAARNVISGNFGRGVLIQGALSAGSVVQGNFIGTDATGSNAQGNNSSGVQIQGGATGVTVGGTTVQARNVISGNVGSGVELTGDGTTDNVVIGNFIGTDAAGQVALCNENGVVIADTATDNLVRDNLVSGNTVSGVLIQDAGTTGNKVQGNDVLNNPIGVYLFAGADGNFVGVDGDEVNDADERNVISGNVTGVSLQTDTADNVIAGNFIGTSADGTAALGNEVGIAIFDATTSGTRIGTNADGKSDILERNVIAGNVIAGILDSGTDTRIAGNYIGTDAAGLTALGVQNGVVIADGATGTRIEANLISGNLGHGIGVSGADVTIAANVIGLAANGTPLGNQSGVWIYGGAVGVTVGGATTAARNTISGNDGAGVLIEDDSTNVTVEGNFIGTDATGELDRGNAGDGVNVTGGANAVLRGNVLSGNAGFGVALAGTGTTLAGNRIGSDKDGTTSIPNDAGDVMLGGSGNTVGGTVAAARNVFLGSLKIEGADNVVQGNTFGLMADGATAVTNPGSYGIEVSGPRNLIGGATTTPGTGVGNVISGNGLDNPGIWIHSETSTGTRVEGNVIGLSVTGAFVGRQSYGVLLSDGATGVIIGGLDPDTSNVISGNLVANVELRDDTTTGNVVQGNLIGTNLSGTAAISNTNFGVHLNGAVGNLIGGTDARARNVISGQGTAGVRVSSAQDNVIQGNWIGLAADGTSIVANLQAGIEVDNSTGTLIGGNVVSGGAMGAGLGIGIDLNNTAFENVVQGNLIGTAADGTTARGNKIGIRLNQSFRNLIGGTDPSARNVVSGNDGPGILLQFTATFGNDIQGNWIGLDAAGADLGNDGSGILIEAGAVDNLIGGGAVGAGNVISGNAEHGVEIAGVGSSANTIRGNYIGIDSMGCVVLPNDGSGVLVHDGADVNFIGGPLPEHRNVISGNLEGGVTLAGEFNIVEGNYIGLHSDGLSALPNLGTGPFGGYGIAVSAAGNIIENNVVSGNGAGGGPEVGVGVWIDSAASAGTIVAGNLIGTDAFGTRSLGQQSYGVLLTDGATDILIGGEDNASANVISGNGNAGIRVTQSDFNLIQGNLIGTDKSGTVARANANAGILVDRSSGVAILDNVVSGGGSGNPDGLGVGIRLANQTTEAELLGNFIGTTKSGTADLGNKIGIEIVDSSMNLIGGLGPLDSNIIGGNDDFGIVLSGTGAQFNDIAGNLIGLGMGGSDVGNSDVGVLFRQGARENTVVANFIANNGKGVVLRDASTQGNRILSNSIFDNDTLGIDINDDGVTLNGVSGPVGPNGNQTFPDITAAAEVGTTATVTGTLQSSASMAFTIEFFANTAADPSNHGEGELFLGAKTFETNAEGLLTFAFTFTTTPEMRFVTATATDALGNTSEFSEVQMLAPPQVVVEIPGDFVIPVEQTETPRRIPAEATTPLLNPIFTPPVPVDILLPRIVEEPFEIAFIRETGSSNDAAPVDPGAGQTRTVVAPAAREADTTSTLPEVQPEVQATKVITNTVDGDDSVRLFEELIRSNGGQETSAPVAPKKDVPPVAPKPQPVEPRPTPSEESSRATVIPEPAHAEIPSPPSLRRWLALPATFATISWLWWDTVRRRPARPKHSPRSKRASLEVREMQ